MQIPKAPPFSPTGSRASQVWTLSHTLLHGLSTTGTPAGLHSGFPMGKGEPVSIGSLWSCMESTEGYWESSWKCTQRHFQPISSSPGWLQDRTCNACLEEGLKEDLSIRPCQCDLSAREGHGADPLECKHTAHMEQPRIRPSQHRFVKGRSCLPDLMSCDKMTCLVGEGKAENASTWT